MANNILDDLLVDTDITGAALAKVFRSPLFPTEIVLRQLPF